MTEQIELDLTTAEGSLTLFAMLVGHTIKSFRIAGDEIVLTTVGPISDLEIFIPLPREKNDEL